jgi:hypothetical protein
MAESLSTQAHDIHERISSINTLTESTELPTRFHSRTTGTPLQTPEANCPSGICDLCRGIFDNFDEWLEHDDHYFAHYQSLAEVEQASESGCSLCYQFWRAWLSNDLHSSLARKRVAGLKNEVCKGLGVHIQKKFSGLHSNIETFYCL